MTIFAAILMAFVAGAAEILPVSGTGLLFVCAKFFGISAASAEFQTFRGAVYFGVAFGSLLYYRTQVWDILRDRLVFLGILRPIGKKRSMAFGKRLGILIAFASLPMLPALLLNGLRKNLEQGDHTLAGISILLCIYGAVLFFLTRGAKAKRTIHETELLDAAVAGALQVFSVFPGVSRAGTTLTALMTQGLEGPAAMELSGLMGIPVFLFAGIVQIISTAGMESGKPLTVFMVLGFALSALTAFFTIRIFTEWLSRHKPTCFAFWSWGVAIFALTLFLFSA